jgi:thiol-disulfide isomerase/thioredoxin
MRRTKTMWLGSMVLMGLLVPGMVRADVDPEAELSAMRARLQAGIKEAQDKKVTPDTAALLKEYNDKAKEDVKGVDPTMVEPAKGMAWAQLFQIAREPQKMIVAAQRFLTSNPAAEPKFNAQVMILNGYVQAKDADAILKLLPEIKPYSPATSARLAGTMANPNLIETVKDHKGANAALALLKQAEAQVPFDQLKTPQEISSGDSAIYSIAIARADLLDKEGKQPEALATLEEGIKRLSPSSGRLATTLKSKANFIKVVGSPAPPLKRERGYGEFASLDAYKGKVVVLDFMAHWCPPCKASLPEMKKMYNDLHSKGLEVVSVTSYYGYFDQEKNLTPDVEFAKMEGFIAKYGMTWPVIFGDSTNLENYGVSGIPQFVIIDQSGKVSSIVVGYSPQLHAEMRKTIEDLLNKKVALK